MSDAFFSTCEKILSATANGLYQGIIVVVLAAIAMRFVRTNAATRHAVWFGVLLFVAALIPAHYFASFGPPPENAAAPMPPITRSTTDELGSSVPDTAPDSQTCETAESAGLLAAWPMIELQKVSEDSGSDSSNRPGSSTATSAWSNFKSKLLALTASLNRSINLPRWATLALLSAWVALAGVRLGLVAWRVGEVLRAKANSVTPSARLGALFERLRAAMPARGHVRLRISHLHRTAVVLGFFRPVVLLPAEMDQEENDVELEHVLRHELAHVNRRDDWSNLAQQTILATLFFHPAVWWIASRLSLEREIACDDHVLDGSGRPRFYAMTLANIASRIQHGRPLLAPGVSNNNSQLQERITMILNTHRDRSPALAPRRVGFFTTATALMAALAIYAGPRLVLAQAPEAAPTALAPDVAGPESGPREKDALPDAAAGSTSSVAPVPAVPAVPSTPTSASVAPVAAVAPAPPAPPAAITRGSSRRAMRDMSVEERLDRIERILESIQGRDGARNSNRRDDGQSSYKLMKPMVMPDHEAMMADEAKKAAEQAMRSAEAGQRAAEAGQRAAEKAMRDAQAFMNRNFDRSSGDRARLDPNASDEELRALRSAREALETNLKTLQAQIGRLEAERRKLMKQSHPGDSDDDSKPEAPTPKKAS